MNVHFLSNSPIRINSGFGIVCRNLALGLSKLGHNVSVSNMQGIYDTEYWNNITIYPLNSIGGASGNSFYTNEVKQFISNLKDSKAEIVIIIYPCYDDALVLNRLHEIHPNTVWYYPCEGENLPLNWIKELGKVKKVVPMTNQGKFELEKKGLKNVYKSSIYHGYNPNIFKVIENGDLYCKWSTEKYQLNGDRRKLCERGCFKCNSLTDECKYFEKEKIIMKIKGEKEINGGNEGNIKGGVWDELVGNVEGLEKVKDYFGVETVFGFVGDNNNKRKRIDLLLKSWMSLDEKVKKESLLLLHTLPASEGGYNLLEQKYGNREMGKVAFIYGYDGAGNSWSNEALNTFYNTIDVNVSCSSAEGFSLPTIESMALHKPNIAPKFSSFTELICDNDSRGLLADIGGYDTLSNGVKRCVVNIKKMADCMERLHNDTDERKKMGDNAFEWVKEYNWDNISKDFDGVLNG